jgi:hypothetical protein
VLQEESPLYRRSPWPETVRAWRCSENLSCGGGTHGDHCGIAGVIVQQLDLNQGADAIDESTLGAKDASPNEDRAATTGMLTEELYDRLEDQEIKKNGPP